MVDKAVERQRYKAIGPFDKNGRQNQNTDD